MWLYVVAARKACFHSSRRFGRSDALLGAAYYGADRFAGGNLVITEKDRSSLSRHRSASFSSQSSGGGRGNNRNGGRGYGGRGTGRGNSNNRNQPYQKPRDPSNRSQNFDERVLQPAARGELFNKHDSGIPRLAARKNKARLDPVRHRDKNQVYQDTEDEWLSELGLNSGDGGRRQQVEAMQAGMLEEDDDDDDDNIFGPTSDDDYFDYSLIDENKYFWSEEEVEQVVEPLDDDDLDENGEFEMEYLEKDSKFPGLPFEDDSDIGLDPDADRMERKEIEDETRGRGNFRTGGARDEPMSGDPESNFFSNQFDAVTAAAMPDSNFQDKLPDKSEELKILPLRNTGPGFDDFLEAMTNHPAEYAKTEYLNEHADSRREPKPYFGKDRLNPPLTFVERYSRFLYVSGLPPLFVHEELGNLENTVHSKMMQKTIGELAGVDSSQVFPASITSGFVGFHSPKELAFVLEKGPSEKVRMGEPRLSKYQPSEHEPEFTKLKPECIVQLSQFCPGHSSASLLQELFPEGTEVKTIYGDVKPEDIYFLSPSTALIRFSSEEEANSAVESMMIQDRLQELGKFPVRFFRARRELVHIGFGGSANLNERRRQGPRLILDTEMPPKNFYISHANTIHVKNLDVSTTKEEISKAFQPFCEMRRDIKNSVELLLCEGGLPTGEAYVGFDLPGEAEACIKAGSGRIDIGNRLAVMRLVKDRKVPNRPELAPQKRLARSEEELLEDLHGWERYVDPADIKLLEEGGVPRSFLNEALRGIRYTNPTFGSLDLAIRSEAIQPDLAAGELYKNLVQEYVATLIECLSTRDDVGEPYKSLHFPDEPIDLSIFDAEEKRQKELEERRANPI